MRKNKLLFLLAFCLYASVVAAATKNPLSAVAEYNLKADGTFETSHSANSAYFTWPEVKSVAVPKGYHVPSKEELTVISGLYPLDVSNQSPCPQFASNIDKAADETVTIYGKTMTLNSHYYGESKRVCYAIRFVGGDNEYVSAYKWEPVFSANDYNYTTIDGVKVTCRLLGPAGADIDVKQIANDAYWASNNSADVTRFFAAAGYGDFTEDGTVTDQNVRGRYWSSTPRSAEATGAWGFGFDAYFVMVYPWISSAHYCLRCFKDDDAAGGDTPQPSVDPKDNPLSVVAEYNLNADGTFETSHSANSAYFKWSDVKSLATPKGYHVPTKEELLVVSGIYAQTADAVYPDLSWDIDRTGDETVTLFGNTATLSAHYYGEGEYVCYAIRFIGGDNKYVSAYKWEPVFSPDDTNMTKIEGLRVTCRLLGPAGADMDVKQLANASYWSLNNSDDVVRYFPAAGYGNFGDDDTVLEQNLKGRYWSATPKNEQATGAWGFGFDSDFVMVYSWISSAKYCVRCFKDDDAAGGDTPKPSVDPKDNPLSVVAEYNLKEDGSFDNSHNVNSAYFKWADLESVETPKGYHIPTKEELLVVSGIYAQTTDAVYPDLSWDIDRTGDETVTLFGNKATLSSHYYGEGEYVCYAIRFIGGDNKYVSAYKWEPVFSADDTNMTKIEGLRVTCRLLGPAGAEMDVKQLANASYWSSNNGNDVVRYFPAAGYGNFGDDDTVLEQNSLGRYWSSTPKNEQATGAWGFGFDSDFVMVYSWISSAKYCVRCFKDSDDSQSSVKKVSADKSDSVSFGYDNATRTISVLGANAGDRISIFNIMGLLVGDNVASGAMTTIDASHLEPGLYVVTCKGSSAKLLVK